MDIALAFCFGIGVGVVLVLLLAAGFLWWSLQPNECKRRRYE